MPLNVITRTHLLHLCWLSLHVENDPFTSLAFFGAMKMIHCSNRRNKHNHQRRFKIITLYRFKRKARFVHPVSRSSWSVLLLVVQICLLSFLMISQAYLIHLPFSVFFIFLYIVWHYYDCFGQNLFCSLALPSS